MKKILKMTSAIWLLTLLAGCGQNPSPTPGPTPGPDPTDPDPTDPVKPGEDPVSDDEIDETSESTKILSISISDGTSTREADLIVSKKLYLTVNFVTKDGVELDLDKGEKDVTWSSSHSDIASVDQYGRVTGIKEGVTSIICVTALDNKKATFTVYVYNSEASKHKEWQKIDGEDIDVGDIIVLACPEEGVSATNEITGRYLHEVETTFSSDYKVITSLPSDTCQFVVGEGKYGYTLENEEGQYLAVTNEKKVTFVNSKGNIDWMFTDYQQGICMESTSTIEGWMMYNAPAHKFSVYNDDPSDKMFFVSIYRLTVVRN